MFNSSIFKNILNPERIRLMAFSEFYIEFQFFHDRQMDGHPMSGKKKYMLTVNLSNKMFDNRQQSIDECY